MAANHQGHIRHGDGSHFLAVHKDLCTGGISVVAYRQGSANGLKDEFDRLVAPAFNRDALGRRLEARASRLHHILTRVKGDDVALVEAVITQFLIDVEAFDHVRMQIHLVAANLKGRRRLEAESFGRLYFNRQGGESGGQLDKAGETLGIFRGDYQSGIFAHEATFFDHHLVAPFSKHEVLGQHTGVLIHIDDGAAGHGLYANGAVDILYFILSHKNIGGTFLGHRNFNQALAALAGLVGLGVQVDDFIVVPGLAPFREGGNFPSLAGRYKHAVLLA